MSPMPCGISFPDRGESRLLIGSLVAGMAVCGLSALIYTFVADLNRLSGRIVFLGSAVVGGGLGWLVSLPLETLKPPEVQATFSDLKDFLARALDTQKT